MQTSYWVPVITFSAPLIIEEAIVIKSLKNSQECDLHKFPS